MNWVLIIAIYYGTISDGGVALTTAPMQSEIASNAAAEKAKNELDDKLYVTVMTTCVNANEVQP
jgi:hypothetical protein